MKAAAVPSVHPLGHASPSSLFLFILFLLLPGSGSRRVGGEAGRKEPDGPQSPPGSGRGPPCPRHQSIELTELHVSPAPSWVGGVCLVCHSA